MPAALEFGAQKDIHQFRRALLGEQVRPQGEHVGVVMLAGQPDLFVALRRRGPHSRNLVGRDGHSDPGIAHQDAAVAPCAAHFARHPLGEIRVIARLRRIRAEVHHFMPVPQQFLPQVLFEGKTGVIGADGYLHRE